MMDHEALWNKVIELAEETPCPSDGQERFLFGGGLCGTLTIPLVRDELRPVAICDNDKSKHGQQIEGLPCISPDMLGQYSDPFVFISSSKNYKSIHAELLDRGIPHCNLEAYVVRQNRQAFQEVYDSLDDASKRVYAGVLYCRLQGDVSGTEPYCTEDQYFCFPRFRYIGVNDTYVDCGAFAGDVVQKVVERSMGLFHKIYAFEPSGRAFAAMKKRVSFLSDIWAFDPEQVVCEQKGIGSAPSFGAIHENSSNLANTSVSCTDSGGTPIEIVSLDSYFAGRNEERITFIKADIEGFEWDMLHGAEQTIRKHKPNLAICIYHNIFDYVRIVNYLKELVPEYTFSIRHHWNDLNETVLYGYVK